MIEIQKQEKLFTAVFTTDLQNIENFLEAADAYLLDHGIEEHTGVSLVFKEVLLGSAQNTKKIQCAISIVRPDFLEINLQAEPKTFLFYKECRNNENSDTIPLVFHLSDNLEVSANADAMKILLTLKKDARFDVQQISDYIVIRPSGNMSVSDAEKLRVLLVNLMDKGNAHFRFNLEAVDDMNSMVLSVFLCFAKMLLNAAKEYPLPEIIHIHKDIELLFRLIGVDKYYKLISDVSK